MSSIARKGPSLQLRWSLIAFPHDSITVATPPPSLFTARQTAIQNHVSDKADHQPPERTADAEQFDIGSRRQEGDNEDAIRKRNTERRDIGREDLIQAFPLVRRRGCRKARPVAFCLGGQRELADGENGTSATSPTSATSRLSKGAALVAML
jgi:hypothetical protein